MDGYDLAVIGSGAAAFAAAITAVEGGASVIMIERGEAGGTCVNTGCVPSKALLAAAAARHSAGTQASPGIATQAGPVDMAALIGGKDDLVATGSAPWAPPVPGLDEADYLTSTTAMELTELPESLVVIGGNAVGLELGQLFARLGTRVTIVEALGRIAPFDEPEVSAAIERALNGEGVGVVTGPTVTGVRRDGRIRSVLLKAAAGGRRELACGQVLVAAGRRPVTADLNLAAVGVRAGRLGEVVTDTRQRTGNPRIWAAGDVTGGPPYVYTAAAQGSASAAVYAIRARMTVPELAGTWAPYLTMSEALRLAAQSFSRDVTKLSCCAA